MRCCFQEEIVDETDAYVDNEKTEAVDVKQLITTLPPQVRTMLQVSQHNSWRYILLQSESIWCFFVHFDWRSGAAHDTHLGPVCVVVCVCLHHTIGCIPMLQAHLMEAANLLSRHSAGPSALPRKTAAAATLLSTTAPPSAAIGGVTHRPWRKFPAGLPGAADGAAVGLPSSGKEAARQSPAADKKLKRKLVRSFSDNAVGHQYAGLAEADTTQHSADDYQKLSEADEPPVGGGGFKRSAGPGD